MHDANRMMNDVSDVSVIGSGLAGGVLTLLLRRAGYQVAVVDSREPVKTVDARPDPRALAVTPASRCILEHAGVWPLLPPDRIGHFHAMQVWDAAGNGAIRFADSDIHEPALGYIIEAGVMQYAIDAALAGDDGIVWQRPDTPAGLHFETDRVRVELDSGQRLAARLLVAADGQQSATRELAGIGYPVVPYQQKAVAAVVETALPHDMIARQRFLADGPLAFLPMAGSNQCGIVWSTTPDHAEALLAMADSEFAEAAAAAFGHELGAITQVGRRGAFPLLRAQATRYVRERFALVGDAAHSLHPLAGQGANMGWLDVACLVEVLTGATDPGNRRALRRYERWRRSDNYMMQLALDGLHHLFLRTEWPMRRLRNMGLAMTHHSGPVKNYLMRYAMGRVGDLPALARCQTEGGSQSRQNPF